MHTEEGREDLARQVSILVDGWSERREYAVRVGMTIEYRAESYWHPPLLVQLKNTTQRLVRPRPEGGGGDKAGTRPPGAFEAASLLDEIGRYAARVRNDWRSSERPAFRTTVGRTLLSLYDLSGLQTNEAVREVSWHLRGYVRQGRIILGHDAPTRAFADTVCGTCGGELRVPIDHAGPVFCSGTPETGPCGTQYTPMDWIALAMEME